MSKSGKKTDIKKEGGANNAHAKSPTKATNQNIDGGDKPKITLSPKVIKTRAKIHAPWPREKKRKKGLLTSIFNEAGSAFISGYLALATASRDMDAALLVTLIIALALAKRAHRKHQNMDEIADIDEEFTENLEKFADNPEVACRIAQDRMDKGRTNFENVKPSKSKQVREKTAREIEEYIRIRNISLTQRFVKAVAIPVDIANSPIKVGVYLGKIAGKGVLSLAFNTVLFALHTVEDAVKTIPELPATMISTKDFIWNNLKAIKNSPQIVKHASAGNMLAYSFLASVCALEISFEVFHFKDMINNIDKEAYFNGSLNMLAFLLASHPLQKLAEESNRAIKTLEAPRKKGKEKKLEID